MVAPTGFEPALPPSAQRGVPHAGHRTRHQRKKKTPPGGQEGVFFDGSPDGIRTRATALRGRRARPLHNGAIEWMRSPEGHSRSLIAGVLGLEPRLTGPEPVGLPITPYPMVGARRSMSGGRLSIRMPRGDDTGAPWPAPKRRRVPSDSATVHARQIAPAGGSRAPAVTNPTPQSSRSTISTSVGRYETRAQLSRISSSTRASPVRRSITVRQIWLARKWSPRRR